MMENPIKVDDLGGNPLFSEISISLKSQFSGGVFSPVPSSIFLCVEKKRGPKVVEALTIWYFVRPEQYSASLKPDSQVGHGEKGMAGCWESRLFSENFWLEKTGGFVKIEGIKFERRFGVC